jgi:hypothetical protein
MVTPLSAQARAPFQEHRMQTSPARRRRVATKVNDIPDGQLACRAGRHDWPMDRLQVGKPLPRGLEVDPAPGGCYQMTDICQRCGKRRIVTTLPQGVYDTSADYDYKDPADWVRLGRDLEVTKRELRAENIARNAERLFR